MRDVTRFKITVVGVWRIRGSIFLRTELAETAKLKTKGSLSLFLSHLVSLSLSLSLFLLLSFSRRRVTYLDIGTDRQGV
jgi:hypothetical protein